ncbi:MAG: hypothetical protein R6U59_04605 [Eubacteriales bacterium]
MTKININPGICGLESIIFVEADENADVNIKIDSQCPHIKNMEEELKEINGYNECFTKFDASQVYKAAVKHCKHVACPVPSGIIKGIEVACGLALPKEVVIKIEK